MCACGGKNTRVASVGAPPASGSCAGSAATGGGRLQALNGRCGRECQCFRIEGSAARRPAAVRSEEHTSELQSLMRSSYAVFCLTQNTLPTATSSSVYIRGYATNHM